MKEPTYRQTLGYAWEAVWHNKILWVFGLLSVFLGQLGFSDIFGKIWSVLDASSLAGDNISILSTFHISIPVGVWNILGIVWLIIICVSIAVMVVFLAVTSQGALISYSADWFKTHKHKEIDKSWHNSVKHFWNILLINLVRQAILLGLLVGFVFVAKYFFSSQSWLQGLLFALASFLALFVSLFLSVFSVYTLCYLVLDGKGLVKSIKKAWLLLSDHFLVSLEVGVVLMLLNLLLVAVIIGGSFFAFLPTAFIWIAAGISNSVSLAVLGLIFGIFLVLLFIVLVAGLFNAFTTSAWVFLFIKMHKEGISSRLVHYVKHMFSR